MNHLKNGVRELICWLEYDDIDRQVKEPYNLDELHESLFLGPVNLPKPPNNLIDEILDRHIIKEIIE